MANEKPAELSWDVKNPSNLNYVRPTAFRLNILNLPQVSFFCQSVTLPGLSMGVATQATPLANLAWPGEKLTWDEMTIKFIIQSQFENYTELYNWFIGIGSPTNSLEFTNWAQAHGWIKNYPGAATKAGAEFSDGTLTVINANNNPVIQFQFMNLFPTSLQGVNFDISEGNTDYLTATATFRYQYFVPTPT